MPNRLQYEKSPYLLQHQNNPVDWYPWCDEAFSEAQKRDIPVFLSIGYSSCHWCHVMERESFEQQEVADVLNKDFISIKVDREEMPDIDTIYMNACTMLTGSGGWPLSCFLSYDKKPFYAGTYFPKENFINILNAISFQWNNNRGQITSASNQITQTLSKNFKITGVEQDLKENVHDFAFSYLKKNFDKEYGGFNSAPKFPSLHTILYLLRYFVVTKNDEMKKMIETSLNAMYKGGIFDHIGGGFSRYSTDKYWLVPHFEKMMYDNAMFIIAYVEAGALINKNYFNIARKTLDYCLNEMYVDGAFYTAQDADSEGVEGKFYVFTPNEVESVLGKEDGNRFCELYDITAEGNFEGKNIPNLIKTDLAPEDIPFAEQCTKKLYEYRSKRVPPFKDDKYLTSINGLMLAALSITARHLDDQSLIQKAEGVADFILNKLTFDDRLYTGFRENLLSAKSTLDDYAYVLWGFYELYHTTLNKKWLNETIKLAQKIITLFYQDNQLFLSANDVPNLPVRAKNVYDGALPSGSNIIVGLFLKLYSITQDSKYNDIATTIIKTLAHEISSYPTAFLSLLSGDLYLRNGGTHVTIENDGDSSEAKKIVSVFNPFITISIDDGNQKTSENTAFIICSNKTCLPKITNVEEAIEKIKI